MIDGKTNILSLSADPEARLCVHALNTCLMNVLASLFQLHIIHSFSVYMAALLVLFECYYIKHIAYDNVAE